MVVVGSDRRMVLLVAEIPTTEGLKMNNIYTDAKGNKFGSIKAALYVARELNATAQGGIWNHEIDNDKNIYLWFQEFEPAKVGE
jgi:hypothetical protein